ncbi:hypothetical protein DTO169E5_295 [Paecilomyces variotii]|nr:hypothetical protein DTO169E5_295 [Paecilomyces variotii]
MSLASKVSALVNNPDALKVFLADRSSAGSWASMHFLSTYASYKPALEPEEFDVCLILLTQPVPVKIVELENAGHYPLEDPGLQQMADAIIEFLRELVP